MQPSGLWQVFIDTGGTFTDCVAIDPSGETHRAKVLSSGELRAAVSRVLTSNRVRLSEHAPWPDDFITGFEVRRTSSGRSPAHGVDGSIADGDPPPRVLTYRAVDQEVTFDRPPVPPLSPGEVIALASDEETPVLAARLVTGTSARSALPPIELRLATTRATNALLQRIGPPVAFFVTRGFADLLIIRDQTRPDLFARRIERPPPLYSRVIEVDERLDASGRVIDPLDAASLENAARQVLDRGVRHAAVALLHAYLHPAHERQAASILRRMGFEHVSTSAELSPLIRIVPRAETAVVNAFTSPAIDAYLERLWAAMPGATIRVMTSAGGLARASGIRAKDCLLSGPAGGVLGAAEAGRRSGFRRVIGFDMGGTSTDVCRVDESPEYRFEHQVGAGRIQAPALAIETVAAGGGSVCAFRHGRLEVGPRSAGASPGPACYGRGGPLTITDVNLLLGRIVPERFEIPLDPSAAEHALSDVLAAIERETGRRPDRDVVLEAFLALADQRMADAMARISIRRGFDVSDYALVSFGGAGGQHCCRVAERLGISTVLMPRDASLLSAVGLGAASIERFAQRQVLQPLSEFLGRFDALRHELARECCALLTEELGAEPERDDISEQRLVDVRLLGQEATITLEATEAAEIQPRFERAYHALYGHAPEGKPIEVESMRVIMRVRRRAGQTPAPPAPRRTGESPGPAAAPASRDREGVAPATHRHRVWVGGAWRESARHEREALIPGTMLRGPAVITGASSTFIIEPGWSAFVDPSDCLVLRREADHDAPTRRAASGTSPPPARHELAERDLFINRLTSIAGEMGDLLERTAISVNVKERRDFSCALLDGEGRLLVNAPHIPVHLGALGLCVRAVRAALPIGAGDVIITNHPAFGGSHLPDVTIITPVYAPDHQLIGFAAARAHHAEIGGSRPGSMPPDARTLAEEGVVIPPMHLVKGGEPRFDRVERLLRADPFPSRAVSDNLADLRAQVAATRRGADALAALVRERGVDFVRRQMDALRRHASEQARKAIATLPAARFEAEESLDDGSPLRVVIDRDEDRLRIDFSGSAAVHPGNLNATPAIVHSVVLYVLRLLVGEALPLNEGMLETVSIHVPPGLLNPPFDLSDATRCPAVVGGNTEVSQRLTDTLIKALGLMAAGQGTMNNLLFGDDRVSYYETICGGSGAGPGWDGADAVQTHMTNTRLTDPEVLEHRFPVMLERFVIRRGSGGRGRWRGGDGVVRELRFLRPMAVSVLTQRRASGPFGMEGGSRGAPGFQRIVRSDGDVVELRSVDGASVDAGDRLIIETPGGGGWGRATDG